MLKIIDINFIVSSQWLALCKALPSFHTLTGYDYTAYLAQKENKRLPEKYKKVIFSKCICQTELPNRQTDSRTYKQTPTNYSDS